MLEQWRGILVAACVGVALSGCSLAGKPVYEAEQVEVFSAVPANCDVLAKATASSLRLVGGALFDPEARFDRSLPASEHDLRCQLTFDDPVPTVGVHADDPMSRSVVLRAWINPMGTPAGSRKPLAETDLADDAVSSPVTVPGIGDDSIVVTRVDGDGKASVRAQTRIDNLYLDVETSGMNWPGPNRFPVADSPRLRADLRAAADVLMSALVETVPAHLPRTTIDAWSMLPEAVSDPGPPPTSIELWVPCTLSGPPAESAGLPSVPVENLAEDTHHRRCTWRTQDYYLEVSTRVYPFESLYSAPHTGLEPVSVGGRTAVRLLEPGSSYSCLLAFDTPFGVQYGRRVGSTEIRISMLGFVPPPLTQTCATLTEIAESLAPHLPPGR